MWSHNYTSSLSVFMEQHRVGVRLEAATPVSQTVELFNAACNEQRCKCFFFDAGVEKYLASQFKALLARANRDRAGIFVGLTFPADFPCHRSAKATVQRVSSFVTAMGIGALDLLIVPWPSETQQQRVSSNRGERKRDGELFLKTWRIMKRLVDDGTVSSLGVDGFAPWQLDFLIVSQPGPRPAANFLDVRRDRAPSSQAVGQLMDVTFETFVSESLERQQKALVNYSHARQIDVVASLSTAELRRDKNITVSDKAGGGVSSEATTSNGTGYGIVGHQRKVEGKKNAGERDKKEGSVDVSDATSSLDGIDKLVDAVDQGVTLSDIIAEDTHMSPKQIITSWSLHRGTVVLHTAGSLHVGEKTSPTVSKEAKRRASTLNGDLSSTFREVFGLLHPMASRSSFYSPNKRFG